MEGAVARLQRRALGQRQLAEGVVQRRGGQLRVQPCQRVPQPLLQNDLPEVVALEIEYHLKALEILFCAILTEPIAKIGFFIRVDGPLFGNLLRFSTHYSCTFKVNVDKTQAYAGVPVPRSPY